MSQHGYPERLSGRSKVLQEDALCQPSIEVLVESLTGSAFQMTVSPLDTIYVIKTKIFRVEGIPISQQHLLYNFKELEDSASLSDYSIKDGCTLKLVLSVRGGPVSTRRLPPPSLDDLHWRDIKDFVDNNRDEALEWLPPGCKVLLFRDGDKVNVVRVIEDEEEETHSPLRDYCFSEEGALTMCKMIDLRRKMERLSMKRSKKRSQNTKSDNVSRRKSTSPLKKTLSEETLSSTINGLFDETPNFTKYKPSRLYSHQPPPAENMASYPSIFNIDAYRSGNRAPASDKYGLWPPIGSFSDIASSDASGPSMSRAWRTSANYFSREPSSPLPLPLECLVGQAGTNCSSSMESFQDSFLTGTASNLPSYSNVNLEVDSYCEPVGSNKGFLDDGSLLQEFTANVLGPEAVQQTSSVSHSKVIADVGVGSPCSQLVLETPSVVGPLQVPAPSQRPILVAHSSNSGRGVQAVGQLLSNERRPAAELEYDDLKYYFHQPGPSTGHKKNVVRKVVFGSNSHLNNLPETRGHHDVAATLNTEGEGPSKPSHAPSLLGSEPQLNCMQDAQDARSSKKNSNLSHSVSNLYLNSQSNTILNVPHGEFCSNSELDKAEDAKFRRTSTIKSGSMVFSSSTSDLLNLKRNRILPSLSRHRNCEHLDVSDECLDKVDIIKHENLHYKPEEIGFDNVAYGSGSTNLTDNCEACSSSSIGWKDSFLTDKYFGKRTSVNNNHPENQFRRTGEIGRSGFDNKLNNMHNIQLIPNEEPPGEYDNFSKMSSGQSPHRNLEVGSERRSRRIKKIPKLDHNNLQDHKNRLDGVSRRHLLSYGNQGYEAAIQKMPNDCCLRVRDKYDSRNYSTGEQFTPLYERCDTRNARLLPAATEEIPRATSDVTIRPKLVTGLKKLITPVDAPDHKSKSNPDDSKGAATLPSLVSSIQVLGQEKLKPGRLRCALCKKRLSIATVHTCRCGVVFCAPHRYAEVHGCHYDYKAEGQEYLRRANPLVSAPKLPKI